MKINRTYSMDHDLVIALAKKSNQSLEVCRAVRKHLNGEDEFSLRDVPTRQLLASLLSRSNVADSLKGVIRVYLELESTS